MPGDEGHSRVMLYTNGESSRELVHRLVLTAFVRPPEAGEQGCHRNGDATNNALPNLRWGTQSDNWRDRKRHGNAHSYGDRRDVAAPIPWPLPNCWKGVSAENQHWADERIPLLLQTPAAVHFVSLEPLLGAIDLVDPLPCDEGKGPMGEWDYLGHPYEPRGKTYDFGNRACGRMVTDMTGRRSRCGNFEGFPLHRGGKHYHYLDWVIVGGESGPGHRPMELEWARSLRDQCLVAGVPFFFKQASGQRPGMPSGDAALDAWKEFPR